MAQANVVKTRKPRTVAPATPKHVVKTSAASQFMVTQTAKRSADVRLSGTTISAMGSAAKLGWNAAEATSEARKTKLLSTAEKELAAYLMQ